MESVAHVFRILTSEQWQECLRAGAVLPSALDRRDGYMHLSTRESMLETAALYFRLEDAPIILELDAQRFREKLRWEPVASRDGLLFPHLYQDGIPLGAVRACWSLCNQPSVEDPLFEVVH